MAAHDNESYKNNQQKIDYHIEEFQLYEPSLSSLREGPEISYDIMTTLISASINDLLTQLEQAIIDRLKQNGFEFKTKEELHDFAKTRLTIRMYEDKPRYKELYLDNKILIAHWDETVGIKQEGTTVTATINGKHL